MFKYEKSALPVGFYLGYLRGRSFPPKCPASPSKILLSLQYISNYIGKIIQTPRGQCTYCNISQSCQNAPDCILARGGVRACGDPVLFDFWCGFAAILILSCGIMILQTKLFAVFKHFRVISMRFAVFCAVFIRNSVRFCGIRTPLTPHARIPFKTFPGNAPGPP